MTEYKSAILGCGRMSRGHARAYKELGIAIVAGADIAEEGLTRARDDFGMDKTYTDYVQLLDEVKPDLISVVTAEPLHCEMVVAAAERGVKGIVCEKPMAMNLGEAQRMLDACRASGTRLTISHQRYYSPQYAQARDLIAQGVVAAAQELAVDKNIKRVMDGASRALEKVERDLEKELWLLGIPAIYVFNLLRIMCLLVVGRYANPMFDFFHLYFWQATLIIMITSVWLLWIYAIVRDETDPPLPG